VFNNIMVPVDLAHADKLEHALSCAGDLAQHYGAKVTYVGVAATTPTSVAHTPAEFSEKLAQFAKAQSEQHGIAAEAMAVTSHDPSTDLDPTLIKAIDDAHADLVVMASHIPNVADHIWPSNGGTIARHAKVSVMLVR